MSASKRVTPTDKKCDSTIPDDSKSSLPIWKRAASNLFLIAQFVCLWGAVFLVLRATGFESASLLATAVLAIPVGAYLYQSSHQPASLVLGAGLTAERIRRRIQEDGVRPALNLTGFLPAAEEEICVPVSLISNQKDLPGAIQAGKCKFVVVATDSDLQHEVMQQLLDCKLSGVRIMCASDFLDESQIVSRPIKSSNSIGAIKV